MAQVVHDYGGVCQAVTELADETNAQITADEFHTFNRCLDDAQAVTEFTRQRELSIADQGTERIGDLAHELRNALGASMLALGRSLRRLSALLDSSLMQVRFESGLRAPERVSVRELLEEAEVGATLEANGRNLTFEVTTVGPEVEVLVDRQLFAGAVNNLLQNAFKFTRPRGHVSLKASSTADRVLVDVEDRCGGLPPGNADALFGRFERRGRDRTGLGLGLAISRKSIEVDGGEIRVRDKPGQGCIFTIDLPRLAAAPCDPSRPVQGGSHG